MFSKVLKHKHLYDLIRLGRNNDGGYLVEKNSLKVSKALISFGLSFDWSFEKDFFYITQCFQEFDFFPFFELISFEFDCL